MNTQNLTTEDYIAFGFDYNNAQVKTEIIVAQITSLQRGGYLTHFLYGYKSLSEFVKYDEILAIGNQIGSIGIKGWGGKYDPIDLSNKLLQKNLKN